MRALFAVLMVLPLVLALPGSEDEYYDILEAGEKDWRLAFRGTAHIKESVYEAYKGKANKDEKRVPKDCQGVDFDAECYSHYRNDDALDNWWMVDKVLFGIVNNGVLVKTLTFNGVGSTYMNWFSEERYLDSCYKDLKTQPHNYFSIDGQSSSRRRFFINRNNESCETNTGWVVALDGDDSVSECCWEKNTGDFPKFLYSGGPTVINWNDAYDGGVEEADAIVVFVKYLPYDGQPSEYFDVFDSGKREWRLAFRATAGAGVPVYGAYYNGAGIPDTVDAGCKSTDWKAHCRSHYRNDDALKKYHYQKIDQVLFGIVDNGVLVKTITFDAHATDMWSWFQQNRVIHSCWSDFSKMGKNFFRITGHRTSTIQRVFFINNRHGTCDKIYGWVVAVDNALSPPCSWERGDSIPRLLYAAGTRMTNWSDRVNVRTADAFVVFIKYKVFL